MKEVKFYWETKFRYTNPGEESGLQGTKTCDLIIQYDGLFFYINTGEVRGLFGMRKESLQELNERMKPAKEILKRAAVRGVKISDGVDFERVCSAQIRGWDRRDNVQIIEYHEDAFVESNPTDESINLFED